MVRLGAARGAVAPVVDVDGADGAVRAELQVRRDGDAVVARVSVQALRDVRVDALGVGVEGIEASRVLVDGFHSWDWAGARDATAPGRGWWGGVWGVPDGARLGVSLQAPPKLGPLLLRWRDGGGFEAVCCGAPEQLPNITAPPRPLGVQMRAGETLRGDAVRLSILSRRRIAGVGLPQLGARDPRPASRIAGWMSWNCFGPSATAADVVSAATSLAPPGGLVLLDDGWMPYWGDWETRSDFDAALGALADAVHASGRRFGLWVAPFLVDPESRAARDHAELLLRDVLCVRAPRPQHVLDASLRGTRLHLAALGRRLGRLGVDALKLDFLFAGALPGARHDGMSDIAALRAGIAALVRGYRSTAPRGARVLGCGAPAVPLVGLVDACRSGEDSVVNVPPANAEVPAGPHFAYGESLLRGQTRNLAARAWLWGATVPPDVDAVTLAAVGDMPAPTDGFARKWLQLAVRSGGPLLDADAPDGRVTPQRRRMLRRAQLAVHDTAPRPERTPDPLSGSAIAHDDPSFHEWPETLPQDWED
jgi:alpha-galactosidase